MRFTIAAAAVAALIAAIPAYAADMGGPAKQNGQCWKSAKTMDGGTFGTWGACPGGAPDCGQGAGDRPSPQSLVRGPRQAFMPRPCTRCRAFSVGSFRRNIYITYIRVMPARTPARLL